MFVGAWIDFQNSLMAHVQIETNIVCTLPAEIVKLVFELISAREQLQFGASSKSSYKLMSRMSPQLILMRDAVKICQSKVLENSRTRPFFSMRPLFFEDGSLHYYKGLMDDLDLVKECCTLWELTTVLPRLLYRGDQNDMDAFGRMISKREKVIDMEVDFKKEGQEVVIGTLQCRQKEDAPFDQLVKTHRIKLAAKKPTL